MSFQRVEDARDGNWLRSSFMIPRTRTNIMDQRKQLFGQVQFKFTDTALGGSYCINPVAQRCRYADLRVSGRFGRAVDKDTAAGLGRYYSEAFDDNNVIVHLRFGVPEFNSLTTFFTGFYNADASTFARTGRGTGLFYSLGKAAGTVASIPFAPFIALGAGYRWLAHEPASKYYFLKPTMAPYWNAVNNMANHLAVNMGLMPGTLSAEQKKFWEAAGEDTNSFTPTGSDLKNINAQMAKLAPDIFHPDGGVDIYAIANRATRLAHKHNVRLSEIMEKATSDADLQKRLDEYVTEVLTDDKGSGINKILDLYTKSIGGSYNRPAGTQEEPSTEKTGRGTVDKDGKLQPGWFDKFLDFSRAEMADGSAFVSFRVNNPGTVSESFSSSTRESDVASKINSASASARMARFNFAEGNFSDGVIGGTLEAALGAAKDVIAGTLDGLSLSGLAALAGSAFVDIPKVWESSTANLPTMSYTIQLRTPYGNVMSRFKDLMIPTICLLAGVLPLSTGTHSYTQPFLCEAYCKGRAQTRLGIISDLSITRGVGNMGWTQDGQPLGIDITFTIMDLSSVLHMPISPNFSFNPLDGVFDEDSVFNDYLAVLSSLGMMDQLYNLRKFRLAIARRSTTAMRGWTSPARWASYTGSLWPGRVINALTRETDRP